MSGAPVESSRAGKNLWHDRSVEFRSPAPFVAFVLAMVGGVLLAVGQYLGGPLAAVSALVVYGLWVFARERGDDDPHTLCRRRSCATAHVVVP
jgi:hypothetical protein